LLPPLPDLDALTAAWRTDGFRLLAHDANAARIMLTFDADANVAPTLLAQRVKGRLNNALRLAGTPATFSRKVSIRTLGENVSEVVEDYLRDQLIRVDLVDDRYRQLLADAAFEDSCVSLAEPAETGSGRYWNNLHVVLVTADRYRVGRPDVVHGIRDRARETGLAFNAIAVMPDHLHAALRPSPDMTPVDVGIALQNATAKAAGCRLWQYGFYIGTFSDYSLDVVRQRAQLR